MKKCPKYVYEIINKHQLHPNLRTKNLTTVPLEKDGIKENVSEEVAHDIANNDEPLVNNADSSKAVFKCPNNRCIKTFHTYNGYLNHLNHLSKCIERKRLQNTKQYVIQRYRRHFGIDEKPSSYRASRKIKTRLEVRFSKQVTYKIWLKLFGHSISKALPEPEALNDAVEELHEGDALKRKGRAKRVSKNVKKYLTDIVNESMKHRKKLRANVVMKNLRRATDENGELLFDVSEWPDEEQGNNTKKYKSLFIVKLGVFLSYLGKGVGRGMTPP